MINFRGKKIIFSAVITLVTMVFATCGLVVANIVKENNQDQIVQSMNEVSAWSGSGTESNPYKITSIEDINTLSKNIANGNSYYDTYFQLTTDLDYSSVSNFCPIGAEMEGTTMTNSNNFGGVFDGNGHIVSNLTTTVNDVTTTREGVASVGFFCGLGYGTQEYFDYENNHGLIYKEYAFDRCATVKNLKIKNFKVTIETYSSSTKNSKIACVGGIAGVTHTYGAMIVDEEKWNERGGDNYYYKNYGVLIDQCIVEDFEIVEKQPSGLKVDQQHSYISGLIGCQLIGGEDQIRCGKRILTITNCMVLDIGVRLSYSNDKSLVAIISPAYSIYDYPSFSWGYPQFIYYFDISYCVTNNRDLFVLLGEVALDSYGYVNIPVEDEDVEKLESYGYTYFPSAYDNDDYETINHVYYDYEYDDYDYYYDAALFFMYEVGDSSLTSEMTWLCYEYNDSQGVYLKQFLQELRFAVNNSTMGSLEVDNEPFEEWYYPEYDNYPLVIPKDWEIDASTKVLNVWNKYNVEPVESDNSQYRFIGWVESTVNGVRTYTANFGTNTISLTLYYSGGVGTYNLSPNSQITVTKISHQEIKFEFTRAGYTTKTTITHQLNDNISEISGCSVTSGGKTQEVVVSTSKKITLTSSAVIRITTTLKTYNPNFH